jgi:mannonate dehydratase
MLEGWRWYGPDDPVSLDDVRQAGASHIVTALHQVPIGEAWTRKAVEERKNIVENGQPGRSPLHWSVVESIPIPDDVKRLGGRATRSIDAWIASLEVVAAAGIKIVCYNFMPVVDWCRTDLEWELPNGARAMRFDQDRFAAFELHILQRPGAVMEYSAAAQARARAAFERMSQADIDYLIMVIASALPGSTTEPMTIPQFRDRLEQYRDIDSKVLRKHLIEFLARVTPVAHRLLVGGLSGAVRRGAVEGERHLLLHRIARCPRGERSSRHGETLCAADRLRSSACHQTRGRRPFLPRIRSSRRRRRYDRGLEGAAGGKPPPRRR